MSLNPTDLEFNGLTVQERLTLIERLWDSIPDDASGSAMHEWHRDELERRISAADANPEQGIPWERVRARLRSRP